MRVFQREGTLQKLVKSETKLDIQTWAGYIQQELLALFVFPEQSDRVQQDRDVRTGLEEQAFFLLPPPLKKEAFLSVMHSYTCTESFPQMDRDSATPE